jgi:hypothetical protein
MEFQAESQLTWQTGICGFINISCTIKKKKKKEAWNMLQEFSKQFLFGY